MNIPIDLQQKVIAFIPNNNELHTLMKTGAPLVDILGALHDEMMAMNEVKRKQYANDIVECSKQTSAITQRYTQILEEFMKIDELWQTLPI